MFYKVICIVNTYVFCRTMLVINRLANTFKPASSPSLPTSELQHKAFLRSFRVKRTEEPVSSDL